MIDVERLEEIMDVIEDLRSEAMDIVCDARSQGDQITYERAYQGWSAEIQMALSTHHEWLSSLSMDTLEETIEACRALNGDGPCEEADEDWDENA